MCVFFFVRRLVGVPVVETKQALGKLIRTIGSTLDTEKNTVYMKDIFRLLDKHANNKAINSRMRFMIRDLAELRVRGRGRVPSSPLLRLLQISFYTVPGIQQLSIIFTAVVFACCCCCCVPSDGCSS